MHESSRPLPRHASIALCFVFVACGDDGYGGSSSDTRDTTADVEADVEAGPEADADTQADTAPPSVLDPIVESSGTRASMDFTLGVGFYAAPWPSDARRGPDGRPDLSGFDANGVDFVEKTLAILERDADGFSVSAMVSFAMSGAVDVDRLPDAAGSLDASATVQLIDVDPGSPDYLARMPVVTVFQPDPGPFGAPNLLTVLPYQGIPLRSHTTYAAVVMRSLADPEGEPLGVPPELATLARGEAPAGMSDEVAGRHRDALVDLAAEDGLDLADVAAITVFTTGDPRAGLTAFRADLLSRPRPELEGPFELLEIYDDFCVFEASVMMPTYQSGTRPFLDAGGGWRVDDDGAPILQGTEQSRIFATIPRSAMPENGYPIVVYVRAGGGGDRPLVDRGVRPSVGGETEPGSGPAIHLARAGWAGIQADGPNGGLRNVTNGDENALLYPVTNPEALRDNLRESALETSLLANMLDGMTIDAGACDGASSSAHFDAGQIVLMGHSNGAWIGPMAVAVEPLFRAAILSGAGGSWIENLVYKKSPLDVPTIAELLLRYSDRHVHRHDPAVNLLQWAGEPADPALYGAALIDQPPSDAPARHVLMFQGIVDTYILPTIAHASSLAIGLDLAGDALEGTVPELSQFPTLEGVLPLVGRERVTLPVEANRESAGGDRVTAVVVQYLQDGVEDGHEVMYQLEAPKHQLRCFLQGLVQTGSPVVVVGGGQDDPCP